MSLKSLGGAVLLLALAMGCGSSSPTSPTLTVQSLLGSWTSSSTNTSSTACTNFAWTVTSLTSNSGSGTFSATCLGSLNVSGNASGTLSGSTVTWTASGSGTPTGGGSACDFSLSGTATLESNNQVRIPYSGTTCMGPVSGVEVLKK